eukprot:155745_1
MANLSLNVYAKLFETQLCLNLQYSLDEKCNLQNCSGLKKLKQSLNIYRNNENDIFCNDNSNLCLHNFFHLISKHKTDDDFEYIYNELGGFCDIKQCKIFERHHRNRREQFTNCNTKDIDVIVNQNILDKIHSYYCHCYDIGYKLNKTDKQILENIHKPTNNIMVNNRLLQLNKTISTKHKLYRTVRGTDKPPTSNRFEAHFANNNEKIYSFGFKFLYDDNYISGNIVPKKYKSFKQEVTTNPFSVMTMLQFITEFKKAKMHYNSYYCKQYIRIHDTYRIQLSIEHLLAVLIYCNYSELQFNFSKTYRKIASNESIKCVLNRHSNFYFWGKHFKANCS